MSGIEWRFMAFDVSIHAPFGANLEEATPLPNKFYLPEGGGFKPESVLDELTAAQLYAVLRLRSEVFVVEQACIFQDMDGADPQAMHVLGSAQGALVAYARCLAAGVKFAEASIGRIVTAPSVRGSGAGHALVEQAIACLSRQWGAQAIRIGAQTRLERFYCLHGFESTGRHYLEDGIAHLEMLRRV